jgi:uncharacterized repeat protein (TIGR04076 family)
MNDWHQVKVKVIKQTGSCEAGHKVGDEYIIGNHAPAGLCVWALYTLFPFVSALQADGNFPWEHEKGVSKVACPDPTNPVVFEIRRIE